MNKLGKNTISNVATKLWSIVAIYLFIPFYINILGEESYGLVSFFATLQNALQLLGLGLANTLRREFAVSEFDENAKKDKYLKLRGIENIYLVICIFIMFIVHFGSTYIANQWLNIESLDPVTVSKVISLMGISISIQMMANLYSGCLFGLDNQILANYCTIIWSVSKSIGSIFIISTIKADLVLFYSWHIIVDLFYLIVLRVFTIKKLHILKKSRWRISDFSVLKSIWKYTLGILVISIIALVNRQLDKMIISKYLTISELGAYNVATTLGSASAIVSASIYTSVFPLFTKAATSNNYEYLKTTFISINKIVNITVSCMAAFIATFSIPLIFLWTGSNTYIEILTHVSFYVVLAVSFVEYQQIPYALVLAYGNTRINMFVGILFLPIVATLTYFGVFYYGLFGAGIVYLVMMVLQTFLYEYLVFKKYITHKPIRLILSDTIIPFILAIVLSLITKFIADKLMLGTVFECIFAVLSGAVSLAFLISIFAKGHLTTILRQRKEEK